MKKNFINPEMNVSFFATENVITTSGEPDAATTLNATINDIIGEDKLVSDASQVLTFTF